jgi:ferric-dicitrate binding protein FerR (iron transport regulator)
MLFMLLTVREIIQEYFNKNHSERVQKEFTNWMNDTTNESEKDESLKNIWDGLNIAADESTKASFETLQTKMDIVSVSKSHKIPLVRKLLRIAAIIILPVLFAGITYRMMKNTTTNEDVKLVECIVPNGEMRTVTLPDSSVVKVNSGSILIYPQHFANTRDIYLNGEAYFTVTKDKTKPFIVKTSDMDVEVLGTVFNVSAYTDSENTSATLESGKVNVRFKNTDKEPVILNPDEQVTYNKSTGAVEKKIVNVENTIAWTDGNTIIQSMPISEVVKIIERKYAMKVYLNSNNYEQERITMKMTDDETVTDFMLVLQYLVPQLKYKIENDKLYIY